MLTPQEEREAFIKWAMPTATRFGATYDGTVDYWLSRITACEAEAFENGRLAERREYGNRNDLDF